MAHINRNRNPCIARADTRLQQAKDLLLQLRFLSFCCHPGLFRRSGTRSGQNTLIQVDNGDFAGSDRAKPDRRLAPMCTRADLIPGTARIVRVSSPSFARQ